MKNSKSSVTTIRNILSVAVAFAIHSKATYAENNTLENVSQIDQLDTISVTANRSEEASIDVPASISVVDIKTIELAQPNYQKELLNGVSGVRVTQTGSSLGHKTSIRMPLNTGPYYLFLQDGIPVQSSGFFNHNGLAYTNFSSAGSAEVLKGAGTALYGSDAVAATINIISNDPSQIDGYKIKADTGSDGFYKLGVQGGAQFSEDSSVGVALSHAKSDGWRDHTSSERTEATATHFMTIDDSNVLKTILSVNATEADMAGSLIGLDELENNPESVGDIADALDAGMEVQRKFDFARLSTEWTHFATDSVELSTIGYVRSNRNQYIATWERNLPKNDSKEQSLGVMFKADIDQENILWTLGTDFELTKANRTYQQLFDYVPSGFGSSVPAGDIYDYDVTYIALSPYAQAQIALTDKLQLGAGLRYDQSKFDYTNNLEDGQYAGSGYSRPSSDNDPSFHHASPKLHVVYNINHMQNVYARYANGFRIPQASRLYSLKTDNIDFDLGPEVSDTFEVGYKLATLAHRMDLSLYYMTIDDTIVRREDSSGDRYYVNGGKTEHQGVELSWLYQMNAQLATRIAYSYSKHEYVNDEVYGDNEQANAPNDISNFKLIYTPSYVQGLSAELEVAYVGEYWLDDDNTRTYDGYTVGNLKAIYQITDQLKVNAKVNNLTDEVYAEDASFSYGKEKYTPAAPRQLYAGIEYSF